MSNQSGATTAGTWHQHQLTNDSGPGVGFTFADLDNDGEIEIIASQFFSDNNYHYGGVTLILLLVIIVKRLVGLIV